MRHLLLGSLFLVLVACGDDSGGTGDDDPGGDGGVEIDADPNAPDAYGTGGDGGGTAGCNENGPECNDCIDNDQDGQIDGFDIECTGAIDNDESSFETGIPGDNMDLLNQDCFFDGDSGAGNDGCRFHTCCLLGLDAAGCDERFGNTNFDPATDCEVSQQCLDFCAPLTPPGCDCFACCTLCDDAGCVDVYTNPTVAPDCDADTLHDPVACPPCTKTAECGSECDPTDCILCPGQTEEDLPPECTETVCPGGATVCTTNEDCPQTEFCSQGCCIAVVD